MKKLLILSLTLLISINTCVFNEAQAKQKQKKEVNKIEYLNLGWWEKFNDSQLENYMKELFNKNHDLKIAALKVKEGEKLVKISFANELPRVFLDGNMGRIMESSIEQKGPTKVYPSYSQYEFQLPLTAGYEIDIWGKNRFKTKSVEQQLKIINEDERATYITLTSAFASEYYNNIKAQELIKIQKELIETQEEIYKKIQTKFEKGLCTENEVLNEQKILTVFEEQLNTLLKTKALLDNQMKVYLADTNKEIKTSSYDQVTIPEDIPEFLTTTIIENRPDYISSQDRIEKLGYDVKVARRELLPKFILYGQVGFNAYTWGSLFNSSSQLANMGILPTVDLFSGGRKLSILKLKKYQYDEALENYQKTILTSIQEVNDNLVYMQTSDKNYKVSKERKEIEAKKHHLVSRKEEIGSASALDVLYSKQHDLIAQKDEVSKKINYIISTISLYKAVGGMNLYSLKDEYKKENI